MTPASVDPRPVILVVDDEPANVAVLGEALSREGEVRYALSGEEALALMDREPRPSLVLLDVMMPGMSGFEVCTELKHHPRWMHVPVVFVTALGDVDAELEGFALGAADYIRKPFNPHVMRARVRRQLLASLAEEQDRRRQRCLQAVAERACHVAFEVEQDAVAVLAGRPGGMQRRLPGVELGPSGRVGLDRWLEPVHPEDRDAVRQVWSQLRASEPGAPRELRYRLDSGEEVLEVLRLVESPDGRALVGCCPLTE